jgi:hypothetical protein
VPLLLSRTPFGNDPLIVIAGLPVLFEKMVTPELMFTVSDEDWFQPAFMAAVLKSTFAWFELIVKENALDVP